MKRRWHLAIFTLIWILQLGTEAWAGELHQFYRGARQMAMGGAYTAVADDQQTLFLNPAGLATIDTSTMHLAVADLSVATNVVDGWRSELSKNKTINLTTIESFLGKGMLLRGQATPSIIVPGLGIGLIFDSQIALYVRNRVMPQATLGFQHTNGVQVGFARTFNKTRSLGKDKDAVALGHEFSAGVAAKLAWRRGGYRKMQLTDLLRLNKDIRTRLAGGFQTGYGVDFGGLYKYRPNKVVTFSGGASWLDFGDTTFGDGPQPQKNNLSLGVAARADVSILHALIAYDFRSLLQETDWRKKSHIGVEFGLPFLSVFGGFNQVYPTYGASANVWLAEVTAAVYTEERGSFAFQIPEKRWMLRADVKIPF